MATTTYEEERKRPEIRKPQAYDYAAPQGTYYGEPGRADSDMAEEILRRAAEQADPQRQAEDDARIQRGRNFWTGANLFANVVANAINVNGTAKGAPNMTWNDAASQKMYDTWRTADQQLKADRKAAQQRFDAMRMQDAQMRAAGAEKRAAEAKAAFNINFQNEQAYQKAQNDAANSDWEWGRKRQAALEDKQAENEEWTRRNSVTHNQALQLQRMRNANARGSGKGAGGGGKTTKAAKDNKNTVYAGPLSIPASDKGEAENIRRDIARRIVDRKNRGARTIDRMPYPSTDKEAQKIIYQHMDDMYANDPQFSREIDSLYGGTQQQADTLAPVRDTVAPQPTAAPAQRPASRGLSGVFGGGRSGGLRSGTPTAPMPRQAQQAADTVPQAVQQAPQQAYDTIQHTPAQRPAQQEVRRQFATEPADGPRYVRGKDGRTYTVEEDGDVYLNANNGYRSFVGNVRDNDMSKILEGIPFTEEEYANLGQWQRRPSAKNNPMMAMPDLSVEKTKEFDDWFKNNTKKK